MERLTIEYCGEYVPKELCSIDRLGGADDCDLCCEYCKATEDGNGDCKGCAINECFNKLGEYENLEEQGKLLKLEDKFQKIMIGQEIFVVEDSVVKPRKICRINEWWNDYHGFQGEYSATPSKGFGSWEFKYEDFDKTVFLTSEEAEAALKELDRGKGE